MIAPSRSSAPTALLDCFDRPARALIVGASGGIGQALIDHLTAENFETVHAPEAICIAFHPGTVETPLSEPFRSGLNPETLSKPADAAERMLRVIDNLTPADSGHFFAWDGQRIPF
ncbi:Rossmann-fold NAD(P)-binding domain-containing protein [Microvirga roseola]|uniref:hypothetical protein n=1 Tax=Microvirga roseola TaxID=2883126 RepID=UPI001E2A64C7|nr:hypothetical protein [Microvirga roseola]